MSQSAQKPVLRISVNLLHPKEVPAKLPERFLKWLINYGRFIVIVVEIVVVASFIARFKYDADLDELKRKINLDLPYVEGLSTDEALIKQTQLRLSTINNSYNNSPEWVNTLSKINSLIPLNIKFSTFVIENSAPPKGLTFKINASTPSNSELSVFLNNLRGDQSFKDITLVNISFEQEQIIFSITGGSR